MKKLIELTNQYFDIQFNRYASIEDLVTKQAAALSALSTQFASSLYDTLDKDIILSCLRYQLELLLSNRPSGAAPMFDAIFYDAYSNKTDIIKSDLDRYIQTATDPEQTILLIYNEVIPMGLQIQVTFMRETARLNGFDITSREFTMIMDQLASLSTDINTSQVCIDLKSYIVEIEQSSNTTSSGTW